MKKLLLTGIAVLSVLSASAAHAREWQGKMPKPVQPLPKYPPVVCIEPNWATVSCADRQAAYEWERRQKIRKQIEQEEQEAELQRQLDLENRHSGAKTVLYYEPGGNLREHEARWKTLAESGDDVELRGPCVSGCTMIMAHVPKSRICFAWGASLRFHMAGTKDNPSEYWSRYMLDHYPKDIHAWLMDRGGTKKMTVEKFWVLDATELWEMGYRKCDPGAYPVPMTKANAIQNYRPEWKTAEEAEQERELWRKKDERAEEAWKEWQRSREPNFEDAP
jgi:hypothetical protein